MLLRLSSRLRLLMAVVCGGTAIMGDTATVVQQLSVQFTPNAKLAVAPAISLVGSGNTFLPFSATLPISYRARSTPGGGGSITLQAASDFSPAGGPSLADGVLTYTCGAASLGTACSGVQKVQRTGQTPVVVIPPSACTGGGGACSAADPNSVPLNFVLENSPAYSTGTYSVQLTLTISSL